jgi:hypothetical protein
MLNIKFNTWNDSGETAEAWSPKAYLLLSFNQSTQSFSGYTVGKVLYLHHVKGLSAPDIKDKIGSGYNVKMISSIIKGFGHQAGYESRMAYETAMDMLSNEAELEVLHRMYKE